ncbi:MAG: ribonuclease H-like domain-containing protein [Nitrososphaerota archaeon]
MSKTGKMRIVKPRICFMDLETTSLDADVGYLVGGGFMDEEGRFKWFYASTPSKEREALSSIINYLSKYHIVFTWNGSKFDIPFLAARALKHDLRVELIYRASHFDLAEFVRNYLKLSLVNLYHVARFLDISKDVSVEGIDVPSLYLKAMKNDRRSAAKIKKHCRDDLEVLRKIYFRILPIIREVRPELAI